MTLAATNYLTAAGAPMPSSSLFRASPALAHNAWDSPDADFDAAKYRRSLTMPLLINYGVKDTAMPVEQARGC